MDIGILPEKSAVKSLPKKLYLLEYSSYAQLHNHHLLLENSNLITSALHDLNYCETTIIYYAAEFDLAKASSDILPTDGYLITYLMYNEVCEFFSVFNDNQKAIDEVKLIISGDVEIITSTRYQFLNEWFNPTHKKFELPLTYFNNKLYKK